MPEDLLQNIIEATNQQAEKCFKPLDYEQLQQFFGIILPPHDYCRLWRKTKLMEDKVRQTIFLGDTCL